ncbi:carbohydrate ABC transporter permease [Streptomyces sp. NPDC001984]|uniref:carbohydrate ABC transporter permease n=1 Tax=Streptomyces sp. NPDC002619 TaxID=3364655 RepID=UPI0036BC2211
MSTNRLGAPLRHLILLILTAAALAPAYLMVTGALKSQDEFLQSPWSLPTSPRLGAFRAALGDQLMQWFLNSVVLTVAAVLITVTIAAMAAWGLVHWPFRGRDTVLALTVSLMVVPPVVLLLPLFQLGAKLGWISTYRIVIIIYVGLMLPFSIYLLANFFRAIPASIFEAAAIDGASAWRTFWRIVLPLSGPPVATLVVVNLLWVWNELLLALVFLQSDSKKTLMVGLTGFQSRYSLDIPTVMAGMSLAVLPLVLAYLFGQRYFIQGLTAGAVKGE